MIPRRIEVHSRALKTCLSVVPIGSPMVDRPTTEFERPACLEERVAYRELSSKVRSKMAALRRSNS